MQQTDQSLQITPYPQSTGSQLVQVGDRVYSITEINPTAIQPNHSAAPYQNGFWDSFKWLAVGLVGMFFFGFLSYSLSRLFLPAPLPAAPAVPPPPPVIIVQPPIEKKPFTRRDCRANGLFGWNETCTEERGYE